MINKALKQYIKVMVIPSYENFDKGHDLNHICYVIKKSLKLGEAYGVDMDMVYTVAAYHDIGLIKGRKNHAASSAAILYNDRNLRRWFDEQQMLIMEEAVKSHSSSLREEPKTIYGKIIYHADRNLEAEVVVYRAMMFGFKYYPDFSLQEHYHRVLKYLQKKYGENGNLVLWLEDQDEKEKLNKLRIMISEKEPIYNLCKYYYTKEKALEEDEAVYGTINHSEKFLEKV